CPTANEPPEAERPQNEQRNGRSALTAAANTACTSAGRGGEFVDAGLLHANDRDRLWLALSIGAQRVVTHLHFARVGALEILIAERPGQRERGDAVCTGHVEGAERVLALEGRDRERRVAAARHI